MRYSQFVEESAYDSEVIGETLAPKTQRVVSSKVKTLIMDAYYSGCLNTYDKIKQDPRILRNSIGFIK